MVAPPPHPPKAAGFFDYSDSASDTFDLGLWTGSGVAYSFEVTKEGIVGDAYGPDFVPTIF